MCPETLRPGRAVAAPGPEGLRGRLSLCPGVIMPPRATLEPYDLVTPARGAQLLGVDPSTMRTWIQRAEQIVGRKVEPLGSLGRWPVYDFNDLAALDAEMRRRQQQRTAA